MAEEEGRRATLQAALAYAARGKLVFPCSASKQPLTPLVNREQIAASRAAGR